MRAIQGLEEEGVNAIESVSPLTRTYAHGLGVEDKLFQRDAE
jgi:hypothetical protein